jgi:hypothetical protein
MDNKYLNTKKQYNIITGEITYADAYNTRTSICGIETPKYFESNLLNIKDELNNKMKEYNKIELYKDISISGIILQNAMICYCLYNGIKLQGNALTVIIILSLQLNMHFYFENKSDELNILIKKIKNNIEIITKNYD